MEEVSKIKNERIMKINTWMPAKHLITLMCARVFHNIGIGRRELFSFVRTPL